MSERFNVADIFGENVFNDTVMKERLRRHNKACSARCRTAW